jgi:hypothetical protein
MKFITLSGRRWNRDGSSKEAREEDRRKETRQEGSRKEEITRPA